MEHFNSVDKVVDAGSVEAKFRLNSTKRRADDFYVQTHMRFLLGFLQLHKRTDTYRIFAMWGKLISNGSFRTLTKTRQRSILIKIAS